MQPKTKKPPALKALPVPPANEAPSPSLAVATAFKALFQGTANEHQQRIAMDWLVLDACGKRHFPYHGEKTHDTSFALGRLFVADQVVGFINADLSTLRRA